LGDVMRRGRPQEETDHGPQPERKRQERTRGTTRSASQRAAVGARLVPSPCPDCGGRRELRAGDDSLQVKCLQCHTIETVTVASLYGLVEKTGVRCRSCGKSMEVRWAPAGRHYLGCQGKCGNTVTADALRQWIQNGTQPENVYVGSRPRGRDEE